MASSPSIAKSQDANSVFKPEDSPALCRHENLKDTGLGDLELSTLISEIEKSKSEMLAQPRDGNNKYILIPKQQPPSMCCCKTSIFANGNVFVFLGRNAPREFIEQRPLKGHIIGSGANTVWKYAYDYVRECFVATSATPLAMLGISDPDDSQHSVIEILKILEGLEYVAECIGHFFYKSKTGIDKAQFVYQLYDGNMADLLLSNRLSNAQCKRLCLDLIKGVIGIHERNVIHLDLKPKNILYQIVTLDGQVFYKPVISDFKNAKHIDWLNVLSNYPPFGTDTFRAPEVENYYSRFVCYSELFQRFQHFLENSHVKMQLLSAEAQLKQSLSQLSFYSDAYTVGVILSAICDSRDFQESIDPLFLVNPFMRPNLRKILQKLELLDETSFTPRSWYSSKQDL